VFSTPSATTVMSIRCPSPMIVSTKFLSLVDSSILLTKDLSILSSVAGICLKLESEEYQVPKSSIEMPMPALRSRLRLLKFDAESTTNPPSVISRVRLYLLLAQIEVDIEYAYIWSSFSRILASNAMAILLRNTLSIIVSVTTSNVCIISRKDPEWTLLATISSSATEAVF